MKAYKRLAPLHSQPSEQTPQETSPPEGKNEISIPVKETKTIENKRRSSERKLSSRSSIKGIFPSQSQIPPLSRSTVKHILGSPFQNEKIKEIDSSLKEFLRTKIKLFRRGRAYSQYIYKQDVGAGNTPILEHWEQKTKASSYIPQYLPPPKRQSESPQILSIRNLYSTNFSRNLQHIYSPTEAGEIDQIINSNNMNTINSQAQHPRVIMNGHTEGHQSVAQSSQYRNRNPIGQDISALSAQYNDKSIVYSKEGIKLFPKLPLAFDELLIKKMEKCKKINHKRIQSFTGASLCKPNAMTPMKIFSPERNKEKEMIDTKYKQNYPDIRPFLNNSDVCSREINKRNIIFKSGSSHHSRNKSLQMIPDARKIELLSCHSNTTNKSYGEITEMGKTEDYEKKPQISVQIVKESKNLKIINDVFLPHNHPHHSSNIHQPKYSSPSITECDLLNQNTKPPKIENKSNKLVHNRSLLEEYQQKNDLLLFKETPVEEAISELINPKQDISTKHLYCMRNKKSEIFRKYVAKRNAIRSSSKFVDYSATKNELEYILAKQKIPEVLRMKKRNLDNLFEEFKNSKANSHRDRNTINSNNPNNPNKSNNSNNCNYRRKDLRFKHLYYPAHYDSLMKFKKSVDTGQIRINERSLDGGRSLLGHKRHSSLIPYERVTPL